MLNKRLILFLSVMLGASAMITACSGQLQDPLSLTATPYPAKVFEEWDPDNVTAPGANLITFTTGDAVTSFPYYNRAKTYPIKFKVNMGALPVGVIDTGVYTAKLEFSANNGSTWTIISGAANIPVTSGLVNTFNWTIPGSSVEGTQYLLRLTATAVSGDSMSTVSAQPFIIDSTPPTVSALSLTLGSLGVANASTLNRSFFGFSLTANDSLTPLTAYCLKVDGTSVPPAETDDCWVHFEKPYTMVVNKTNIPGFIGFVAGAYSLRIWVKDSAENVSVLTAGTGSVGTDLVNVAYNPATAPVITNVLISNDNSVSLSPTDAQLTFSQGQTVYVRWKVVDGDLTSYPLSITYTTDEISFTNVATLQNITNANQGGCTTDANYSGCATFAAPTNGYFRVQVGAIDQTGLISKGGSIAANMTSLRLIAGNTDLGLNGSANNAIFINKAFADPNSIAPTTGTLVVNKRGKIFYLDHERGILLVDPVDGAQKTYLPRSKTGKSTGDGGNYAAATTADTYKIALDYSERLLILEKDRIRRIESDGTIKTIIGGGTTAYDSAKKTSIKASEFKMDLGLTGDNLSTTYYTFQTLPNGNIWFSLAHSGAMNVDSSNLFGIYKAEDDKVYFLDLTGKGIYGNPTYDFSTAGHHAYATPGISFDYRTSQPTFITVSICMQVPGGCHFYSANYNAKNGQNVGFGTHYPQTTTWGGSAYFTSRRGELHTIDRYNSQLMRLNSSTLKWERILGISAAENTGSCPDDALAANCAIDLADAFITENRTVYFVDRGGVVRVILPNGKVKTLFGQKRSFGDNGIPTSARLGTVEWMGVWGSENKVVVYDVAEKYIREFTQGSTGTIYKLCGNGMSGHAITNGSETISNELATQRACFSGYWGVSSSGMVVDSRNGEIYIAGMGFSKLLRSGTNSGRWQYLGGMGSGSSSRCFQNPESNNELGSNVRSCSLTVGWGYPFDIFGLLHPDTITTSHTLGAVEDGTSAAFPLIGTQVWTGTQLAESFYKILDGNSGVMRPIAGVAGQIYEGGLPTTIGVDFSKTALRPIYLQQINAVYVAEDRSLLFGHLGWGHVVRVPITRSSATGPVTGTGAVSHVYGGLGPAITSFNYRWDPSTGQISDVFYCATDGKLKKKVLSTETSVVCPFPKSAAGTDLFSCFGKTLLWDSTKSKLIFPIKQNGLVAIAQYNVQGCN